MKSLEEKKMGMYSKTRYVVHVLRCICDKSVFTTETGNRKKCPLVLLEGGLRVGNKG